MMLGQGGGENAGSTFMFMLGPGARRWSSITGGGEPTAAAVIVATTILLFLCFIYQVFISRPRNKGAGVTTGQARNLLVNATAHCCANCGEEGSVSLKACMSCKLVKYCNADCQKNHWPKHKKECKLRAAEIRDEAIFKDPPAKEDCPLCFIPMPYTLICCMSLPPATISSLPIYDYAMANEKLAKLGTEQYYTCCGKSLCAGCVYSFAQSGNYAKCPFCKADRRGKTDDERVEELMKRVEVNDANSIYVLGSYYQHGQLGLLSDQERAMELWKLAAEVGSSQAHHFLGYVYGEGGDLKKAKFHFEAAAMAGNEEARYNLGIMEGKSGNMDQAAKHWKIAASAGSYHAMHNLLADFEQGVVSRDTIDSTLTAYNNACAEMRSEARDEYINTMRTRLL